MTKKQAALQSKLESWTDQAQLTQATTTLTEETAVSPQPHRLNHSLINRVADLAQQQGVREQEVIGRLLTAALEQVDNGQPKI